MIIQETYQILIVFVFACQQQQWRKLPPTQVAGGAGLYLGRLWDTLLYLGPILGIVLYLGPFWGTFLYLGPVLGIVLYLGPVLGIVLY